MAWDGMRRRLEDKGQEPPEVILARMDERLANFIYVYDIHVQQNKEEFNEIRKDFNAEIDCIKIDLKCVLRWAYIAFGVVIVINIFVVPVVVQHMIKRIGISLPYHNDKEYT